MTLKQKITNLKNYYKQIYFRWRHGLVSLNKDYSVYSEEELLEKFFKGNKKRFNGMKLWESSAEYQDLLMTLLQERLQNDLLDVYYVVLDKAKTGDDKAVKTLLTLQKEVTKQKNVQIKVHMDDEDDHDDLII